MDNICYQITPQDGAMILTSMQHGYYVTFLFSTICCLSHLILQMFVFS